MVGRMGWAVGIFAGLLGLWSGIALLATVMFDAPLLPALAAAGVVVLAGLAAISLRAPRLDRQRVWQRVRAGLIAGFVATVAYDASKALLSVADPSPFNPFEAIRVFGLLLTSGAVPPAASWMVGFGFHMLNGISFGIAYAQFFGTIGLRSARLALVTGVGWGLFLELFQLALFPGWLNIRFLDEFRTISFLGHIAYGATLGLGVRWMLRRGPSTAGD